MVKTMEALAEMLGIDRKLTNENLQLILNKVKEIMDTNESLNGIITKHIEEKASLNSKED